MRRGFQREEDLGEYNCKTRVDANRSMAYCSMCLQGYFCVCFVFVHYYYYYYYYYYFIRHIYF
jgi:hypothetical protein